jgi:hypothetical protein
MDQLFAWLYAHPKPVLNLPPCPPSTNSSILELALQPDLQRQPFLPLFSNPAYIDKLPSIAVPASSVLVACRATWTFTAPSPLKKRTGPERDEGEVKKRAKTEEHITIQHY